MLNEIPDDALTLVYAKSWLQVNIDSLNSIDGNESTKQEIIKLLKAIELIDKIIFQKINENINYAKRKESE